MNEWQVVVVACGLIGFPSALWVITLLYMRGR